MTGRVHVLAVSRIVPAMRRGQRVEPDLHIESSTKTSDAVGKLKCHNFMSSII